VVGVSDRGTPESEPDPRSGIEGGSDDRAREGAADDEESAETFSTTDSAASGSTGSGGSSAADESAGSTGRGRGGETSSGDEPGRTGGDGGRLGAEGPADYLKWAGVAVLAVTALVALFGFYTGVSRAISVWVTREFRPVVNAAFNLALLLAALGGIGLLLRRTD
jgi:hypothetical protein